MIIKNEQNLASFDFWSGAQDRAERLTISELNELEYQLEERYPRGMTATELNDIVWFDFEEVCEWLGLDVDEVLERGE